MFVLPDLPYAADALAPILSETTLNTHHGKHHNAYVTAMNGQLSEAGSTPSDLESLITSIGPGKLFNATAQSWNHGFFWESMSPSPGSPSDELANAIKAAFGSMEALKSAFVAEGIGHFASGWVWLVSDASGALKVVSTHDAATVVGDENQRPILVCDVWEHAYYLDHKQDRKGFLEAWFDKLANWEFANAQYAAATSGQAGWKYPAPS